MFIAKCVKYSWYKSDKKDNLKRIIILKVSPFKDYCFFCSLFLVLNINLHWNAVKQSINKWNKRRGAKAAQVWRSRFLSVAASIRDGHPRSELPPLLPPLTARARSASSATPMRSLWDEVKSGPGNLTMASTEALKKGVPAERRQRRPGHFFVLRIEMAKYCELTTPRCPARGLRGIGRPRRYVIFKMAPKMATDKYQGKSSPGIGAKPLSRTTDNNYIIHL